MILTITLNPTIDKSTSVEKIEPESKLRCGDIKNEPGGGGINVSKALKKLDCKSITLFPTGGHNGEMLKSLLRKEGIRFHCIPVENETRENFVVLETSTNKQYRFTLPGEPTDIPLVQKVIEYIKKNKFEYIICSGSLLPGLPEDTFAQIGCAAKEAGAKFILDTSGPALKAAVEKGVFLLKPNIGELARLSDIQWLEPAMAEEAARTLINKEWVSMVAVSMGRDGAMLVTRDGTYKVASPEVEKKSTVGAGDSMVAGMVYMLTKNKPLDEVIRFGVACGSAATMNEGTELFHREDADRLFHEIKNI
jgi:6-phosphofructokinase 2